VCRGAYKARVFATGTISSFSQRTCPIHYFRSKTYVWDGFAQFRCRTSPVPGFTFELIGYSDADYAGCKIDRKSTSGTCQFLGRSLVSWASKKQNSVALSTAEAEYVAAGHCCAQLLWMRQTLRDYGYKLGKVPLLCDNERAIRMADNLVEHSRTKHIDIRYHFLRDHQQKGISKLLMLTPTTN
jgi:hypothetical protein